MKKTLLALFFAATSSYSLAADQQQVTVTLASASTMAQGMAMVLANQMQEQGAQVDILLCDKAGDIALKGATGEALKPNNVTPAQLLDGALKKVQRLQCAPFTYPIPVIAPMTCATVSLPLTQQPWVLIY